MLQRTYPDLGEMMTSYRIREKAEAKGAAEIGRLLRIAIDGWSQMPDLQNEFSKLLDDIGVILKSTEIQELRWPFFI